jgi:hypothetical protein
MERIQLLLSHVSHQQCASCYQWRSGSWLAFRIQHAPFLKKGLCKCPTKDSNNWLAGHKKTILLDFEPTSAVHKNRLGIYITAHKLRLEEPQFPPKHSNKSQFSKVKWKGSDYCWVMSVIRNARAVTNRGVDLGWLSGYNMLHFLNRDSANAQQKIATIG